MIKVLFIEDRPLTLYALQTEIKWREYGIEPVAFYPSCEKAAEHACLDELDVIVTDIVMPGINGLEFSKQVHQRNPNIKLIVISAHSKFEYAKTALQLGVFDYLEKPLDFGRLISVIMEAGEAKAREEKMRSYVEQNKVVYRERFFVQLLSGNTTETEEGLQRELALLDLDAKGRRMCCLALYVPPHPGDSGESAAEAVKMLMPPDSTWGPFAVDTDTWVLVVLPDDDEEASIGGRLQPLTKESPPVYIGIGQAVNRLDQLDKSCKAARNALEFHILLGGGQPCEAPNPQPSGNREWPGLQQYEADLIRHISSSNMEGLSQVLDALRQFAATCQSDISAFKAFMISASLKIEGIEAGGSRLEMGGVLGSGGSQQLMPGYYKLFSQGCRKACSQVRQSYQNNQHAVACAVEEFLKKNHTEPGLNLAAVAGAVSLSPNYVSSIFNRYVGKSISEYINQLRVEHAKKLLQKPTLRMADISEAVGYSNQYYFSINFKKLTGQSPMEYRKKHRQL